LFEGKTTAFKRSYVEYTIVQKKKNRILISLTLKVIFNIYDI